MSAGHTEGLPFCCRVCARLRVSNGEVGCFERSCGYANGFQKFEPGLMLDVSLSHACVRCGRMPKLISIGESFVCSDCREFYERRKKRGGDEQAKIAKG